MMDTINYSTINQAHEVLVEKVKNSGNLILDERKSETRELTNIITRISDPLGNYYALKRLNEYLTYEKYISQNLTLSKACKFNRNQIMEYCYQLISGRRDGFIYTYGNRLRNHFPVGDMEKSNVDQVDLIIERLKNNINSRRATAVTFDPQIDSYSEEIPCLIMVDFKIRNNKLLTTAVWRSHDILNAWYQNVVGLSYLSNYIAEELGLTVGEIVVHSISAHIYLTELEK